MIITIFTSPFFSSAEQNFSSNREKSARAHRSQIQSVIIIIIIIIITITTVDVCARAFVVSPFTFLCLPFNTEEERMKGQTEEKVAPKK